MTEFTDDDEKQSNMYEMQKKASMTVQSSAVDTTSATDRMTALTSFKIRKIKNRKGKKPEASKSVTQI